MTDFLNSLLGVNLPFWVYIAILAALIMLGFFAAWFVRTRIFKSRLRKIISAQDAEQTEEAVKKFKQIYSPEKLVKHSRRMERYSRQMGPEVVRETGLAEKWTQKLSTSIMPRAADLRRVLLYCPSSSLFKAFIAAGQHPRLRRVFINWMQSEGEEKVIKLLADSCRGEDFDPAFGGSFLETQSALLRELTGEHEWYARYFAYRILLLDKETLHERNLDDGLLDSHPLVRKTIIENFIVDMDSETGLEKAWTLLWEKLIHDPVYEVREAARKRIAKEFTAKYNPAEAELNADETARVLELLDPECQEDRTFAMTVLESPDKELRFPAAVFLEKCGILSALMANITLDDPAGIEHSVSLLQKALEVNVSGFMLKYPLGDGGPLLAAARLLVVPGLALDSISYLAEKAFSFFQNKKPDPSYNEIYTKTLEAIAAEGNSKALELYAVELSGRENDKAFLQLLLPRIPKKSGSLFLPVLFRFLGNTAFPARDELENILGTFNSDLIITRVFQILNAPRADNPHIVRISALKILGAFKLTFCLQRILESLPTFRTEEIEEFAKLIATYPKNLFEGKARALFQSPEAKIRASLILLLPATKSTGFLKEIRSSLKDVDPDVRVAAVKALLGFGEIKLLNQETSMLRDPIERVRLATAQVIAKHGNAAAIEILKNITADPNETDVVKNGVIAGLGFAESAESIKILISVLDLQADFCAQAEEALSNRTAKRDIVQLLEIFKDAEPLLREKMIPVFKKQGRKAEPMILEILKDDIASLKPYLVKILEETGYVDEAKRRLSDRNVEVRREAALQLSLMDTLPAFRGLVLAAKDPDQEVRVCVVKALEKLKGSNSREILDKLKEDPDNRIRKYTHWALERLDSLTME